MLECGKIAQTVNIWNDECFIFFVLFCFVLVCSFFFFWGGAYKEIDKACTRASKVVCRMTKPPDVVVGRLAVLSDADLPRWSFVPRLITTASAVHLLKSQVFSTVVPCGSEVLVDPTVASVLVHTSDLETIEPTKTWHTYARICQLMSAIKEKP